MADNYLENKYEEYLKKKAEYERRKKLGLLPSKTATPKPTEPKSEK